MTLSLFPALLLSAAVAFPAVQGDSLPPGAIARWNFDQGRGDTLRDQTGNGHHGVIHGAQWVEGMRGKALGFDGDDWVEVPGDTDTQVKSFTLSLWLWQSGNGFSVPLVEFQAPNTPVGVHLWANTDGWARDVPGSFYANLRPHDASASQDGSVRERNLLGTEAGSAQGCRWNHVALTLDHPSLEARLWVNGRLKAKRVLRAFTPRTMGDILLGRRSPTATEWQAGSGLVGRLDEAALYGRALSEDEVLALYGRRPVDPKSIHLGMRTHFAVAGGTVEVPVFLSGDGKTSLSSLRFDLELDTAVARLKGATLDTALAPGWTLAPLDPGAASPVSLSLSGPARLEGAKEGALLRFQLEARASARLGASTLLNLERVEAGGATAAISVTPGRLFVLSPEPRCGDVNGDGTVDLEDARLILQQAVDKRLLPLDDLPAFTLLAADVSGDGAVTSHDAALVLHFALGLLEEFPAERKPLAKRSAEGARMAVLALAAPVRVEGNTWRYRLEGDGLDGLIAGELRLKASARVTAVSRVASGLTGARVRHRFDAADGALSLALAVTRKLPSGRMDVLEIDAVQASGGGDPGLALESAWLNEGGLKTAGLDSKPLSAGRVPGRWARRGRLAMAASAAGLRVSSEEGPISAWEVLDGRGRKIAARRGLVPAAAVHLDRTGLRAGVLWIRVETAKGWSGLQALSP